MRRWAARALGCCVLVLALTAGLTACTSDSNSSPNPTPEPSSEPTDTPTTPVDLSFGVYGSPDEVAAYTRMARRFDTDSDRANLTVEHWRGHGGLRRAVENGEPLPDVFLVSRRDLRWYLDNQLTRPVDTLLDERGVDFGDVYSRDALTAFSSDNRLQCMPYGVAPQVIYYNEDLVDFTRMANRGLDVPADHDGWNWDQFVAAAKFAARPSRGTMGVSIDPALPGIAPFVYAGGGDVFDDDVDPTSLAFSGDGTQGALQTVLPLFRDPKVMLSEEQLAERSALRWFEEGSLGMIAGSRSWVPRLRQVPALRWDVMPIPSIEGQATVGEVTAMCIAQDAESPATSADFLVYATSTEAVAEVAREGYLQPANQEVAFSEDFLQPDDAPLSATVFNASLAGMVIPPLLDTWDELDDLVAPYVEQLFYGAPILDLAAISEQVDLGSQPILNPETATPSPGETPSESASP